MDRAIFNWLSVEWPKFDAERKKALSGAKSKEEYEGILAKYELVWECKCNKIFGGKKNGNATDSDVWRDGA